MQPAMTRQMPRTVPVSLLSSIFSLGEAGSRSADSFFGPEPSDMSAALRRAHAAVAAGPPLPRTGGSLRDR